LFLGAGFAFAEICGVLIPLHTFTYGVTEGLHIGHGAVGVFWIAGATGCATCFVSAGIPGLNAVGVGFLATGVIIEEVAAIFSDAVAEISLVYTGGSVPFVAGPSSVTGVRTFCCVHGSARIRGLTTFHFPLRGADTLFVAIGGGSGKDAIFIVWIAEITSLPAFLVGAIIKGGWTEISNIARPFHTLFVRIAK